MGTLYACEQGCRTSHHACGRCGDAVDASPYTGLMDAHGQTRHRCAPPSARPPEPHECTCGATVYYYRLHERHLDADGEPHRCAQRPIDAIPLVEKLGAYGIYGGAYGERR